MDWRLIILFNWGVPFTVSALVVLAPWALGWVRFYKFLAPCFVFNLQHGKFDNWYMRAWRGWGGLGLMCFSVVKATPEQDDRYAKTLIHETKGHGWQVLVLGLVQPALYVTFTVLIMAFQVVTAYSVAPGIHPYYHNPFEMHARYVAGQDWRKKAERWADYWPWW